MCSLLRLNCLIGHSLSGGSSRNEMFFSIRMTLPLPSDLYSSDRADHCFTEITRDF